MPFASSPALKRLAWGLPVFVVGVIALPLFTDRTFGNDWPDHLWLVWQQGQAIAQLGHPSYYLQAEQGVFQPFFAFYGGTFYGFTGGISALLGQHPVVAYVAVIIAAFAGAYAGWTWLARQVGLRGWWAQLPGLLYVTSPYIITGPFARGDVPESVGTASIPLVAASALAVLRSERLRARDAALLIFSSAWFTACHNITALWGTTFLVATGLVLLFAVGRTHPALRVRRLALTVGLAATGAAVNAWYLFPTLAYAGHTAIASRIGIAGGNFDTFEAIFNPLRNSKELIFAQRTSQGWLNDAGRLNVQMPTLAFIWALAVLGLAWHGISRQWRRFAAGMLLVVVALLALLLTNMSIVPRPWQLIQFPYRAETYVTLGVCTLALAGIVSLPRIAIPRRRSIATAALVVILVVSFGQAIVQQWSQDSSLSSRQLVFQPKNSFPASWYSEFDYADVSLRGVPFAEFVQVPNVTVTGGNRESLLPIQTNGERDTSVITFPSPGPRPLATNVYGGPEMVKVTGARVIGRSPTNELAIEVLAPKGQEARVTFSPAHPLPVVLGQAVTVATLLLWLCLAAWAGLRWVQGRRAAPERQSAPST